MIDLDRVQELETEAGELGEKLSKLKAALEERGEFSETQRAYMTMQVNAMSLYLDILHLRIDELSPQ